MPNAVAELFISLGVDATDVNEQFAKTEKDMTNLGDRAQKLGDSLRTGLTHEFGNLVKAAFPFASVTASIIALTKAQQNLYNVEKASREIGIPTEEYAAWGRAAESLGYSAQDAQSSIASLQSSLQEAALTGRSQAAGVMTYLGVSLFKANGQIKTAGETLKDLSNVFSKMPIEKARIYGQMMGISPATIALLREGKELTKELADALEKGPTAEQAKKAWELQKSWNKVTQSGGDLAREILVDLAPALLKLLEVAKAVSGFFADHSELVLYGGAVLLLTRNISKLATVFQLAGMAGAKAFMLIGTAMKAHPILLIISAILSALYSLGAWFNGEASVIGSILERMGLRVDTLREKLKFLGDFLKGLLSPFIAIFSAIGSLMSEALEPPPPPRPKGKPGEGDPGERDDNAYSLIQRDRQGSPIARAINYQHDIKSVQRESMLPPSVVNNRNSNRNSHTEVHNNVTVNAPGGEPKAVTKATMTGIKSGFQGFNGDLIAFRESGFESK